MWRITPWFSKARPTAITSLAVMLCLLGCVPDPEDVAPTLHIVPNTAPAGATVKITAYSDGQNLSSCNDITPELFVFSSDAGVSDITMDHVEMGESGTIEAIMVISDDAVGTYDVVYYCTQSTLLEGTFEVIQPIADPAFDIIPTSVPAGVQNKTLGFTRTDGGQFTDNVSHVVFGDQGLVNVLNWSVQDSGVLNVTVNVSPSAPASPIDVVVFSGATVFQGVLEITEDDVPTIWIEGGSTFFRPSPGADPSQYSVTINSSDLEFTAGPQNLTEATFPVGDFDIAAPGVEVINETVVSTTELTVNFKVSEFAVIGAIRLRVTVDEKQSAETRINIESAPTDPLIEFLPKEIPKGIADVPVLATAKNFEFDEDTTVVCSSSGCNITPPTISGPTDKLVLLVSLDEDWKETHGIVEVNDSGGLVVRESLIALNTPPPTISPVNAQLTQGGTFDTVRIQIQGGLFSDEENGNNASVLDHSGIQILEVTPGSSYTQLFIDVNVVSKAPVGPAHLQVSSDGKTMTTLLDISPSGADPWVTVSPRWIPQGRRDVSLSLVAYGFAFTDETLFRFDDPAVTLKDFVIDADDFSKGLLTIELSPRTSTDTCALYTITGHHRTASTFKVFDVDRPTIYSVTPEVVGRGETALIQIGTLGMDFGETPPIVEVTNGLGVYVDSVELQEGEILVTVRADKDGPTGWLGLSLLSEWRRVIAPILISDGGSTDTLTMQVEPSEVSLGSGPHTLELSLPAESGTYFNGLSEIVTTIDGSHVTSAVAVEQPVSQVTTELDIGFDVPQSAGQIEITATTDDGAAVGFVDIIRPLEIDLDESTPWEGTIPSGENVILKLPPESRLSALHSSTGYPGYANPHFELISSNDLDRRESGPIETVWKQSVLTEIQRFLVSTDSDVKLTDAILESVVDDEIQNVNDPLLITNDPCDNSMVVRGNITEAFEVGELTIESWSCRLVVDVIAREITDRPLKTPDAFIRVKDQADFDELIWGWPTDGVPDPRVYLDPNEDVTVYFGAEMGTTGSYLVNIRRPYVIREINRDSANPYIEIETDEPPVPDLGDSLDDLTVELLDVSTGLVLESLSLAGLSVVNDGIIVIAGGDFPGADLVNQAVAVFGNGPFAVRLVVEGEQMDAVQVGTGTFSLGEGTPVTGGSETANFRRVGSIDSDDNAQDFIVLYQSSY